jgi:hypothetical protein
MVLSHETIIQHITSFADLDLDTTRCIFPVLGKEEEVIRACKMHSSASLESRQDAIKLFQTAVSDESHDTISGNIREVLKCCFCRIHNNAKSNDGELVDAICDKWKEELSISLQNEAILCGKLQSLQISTSHTHILQYLLPKKWFQRKSLKFLKSVSYPVRIQRQTQTNKLSSKADTNRG